MLLIEDCAQATGTSCGHDHAGTFGHFGCHSFYPTKNLGSLGDGGAITTSTDFLFDLIRNYRNYGSNKKYENNQIGVNSRLDEIQAAFLSAKLHCLEEILSKKRYIAKRYISFYFIGGY